ncbi:hypothetical protein DE146DRAFT_642589 [Phaeosphaeria sp. MPI-PUGE-AT-0046c]|nr:hypothetical protein DE146DRAFT_642589 [Phaeosphaeria sp. MPI-PUGE-AT-0046c]
MGKAEDMSNNNIDASQHDAPPSYSPDTSNPPTYDSLAAAMRAEMAALAVGDPSETVSVPMITRQHHPTIHDLNPFSRKTGKITQSVSVRKMTREMYLKHYIKDAEGNFIGSANPAPDAGLVFVPGKSTPEDVMKQVSEVAFRGRHIRGGGLGSYGQPLGMVLV